MLGLIGRNWHRARAARSALACALGALASCCANATENRLRRDLEVPGSGRVTTSSPARESSASSAKRQVALSDGKLASYIARALEQNAELEASYQRYRARVLAIAPARRLPEPVVSFGVFVRSVETRVGPQLARVSLQQSFPWPSKLSAGADALTEQAHAEQRRFEALALSASRRVAEVYWKLWQLRQRVEIHQQHLLVLRGLSDTVRARFMTGGATLAAQQQVDLSISRLEDNVAMMYATEPALLAALRAEVGTTSLGELPIRDEPPEALLPVADETQLRQGLASHPELERLAALARSHEARALAQEADAYPRFTLGADWIITGEAEAPNVPQSGKDAVVVGGGFSLPLWQGSYDDAAESARAEAAAERAQARSSLDHAHAELAARLTAVREAVRRVKLYKSTLLPQVETAYTSVLGAYATGRADVAQTLLIQGQLLDLRVELEQLRGDYAIAWARLEELVGAKVGSAPAPPSDPAPTDVSAAPKTKTEPEVPQDPTPPLPGPRAPEAPEAPRGPNQDHQHAD
jgi:outer membrane protein TolC